MAITVTRSMCRCRAPYSTPNQKPEKNESKSVNHTRKQSPRDTHSSWTSKRAHMPGRTAFVSRVALIFQIHAFTRHRYTIQPGPCTVHSAQRNELELFFHLSFSSFFMAADVAVAAGRGEGVLLLPLLFYWFDKLLFYRLQVYYYYCMYCETIFASFPCHVRDNSTHFVSHSLSLLCLAIYFIIGKVLWIDIYKIIWNDNWRNDVCCVYVCRLILLYIGRAGWLDESMDDAATTTAANEHA